MNRHCFFGLFLILFAFFIVVLIRKDNAKFLTKKKIQFKRVINCIPKRSRSLGCIIVVRYNYLGEGEGGEQERENQFTDLFKKFLIRLSRM